MALEHMVWLTPKAGVSEDKMEDILASIRALTHSARCAGDFSGTQRYRPCERGHPWRARYA